MIYTDVAKPHEISYPATEALIVPFSTQGFDHHIGNWPSALLALGGVATSMAVDTPCIAVLLHEGRRGIKRLHNC
jgi:hypothetical protein